MVSFSWYLLSAILCKFWLLIPSMKYDWQSFSPIAWLCALLLASFAVQKLYISHGPICWSMGLAPALFEFYSETSVLCQCLKKHFLGFPRAISAFQVLI